MTPMEILSKIVEAEVNARAVFDEAEMLKAGFEDYVKAHIDELRKQYFDSAEKEISSAREREKARADSKIKELDEKLETELAEVKDRYEKGREAVVLKIFKLAVDVDA